MKITHLLAAIALAFVTVEALAEKLVVKGSDTLGAKLVPQLAEAFKAQGSDKLLLSLEGGSELRFKLGMKGAVLRFFSLLDAAEKEQ